MVRQLRARGDEVDAACRNPSEADELSSLGARVHQLDVTEDASVVAFARELGDAAIDMVFNNAGVTGNPTKLGSINFANVQRVFDTNALGALRVSQALLPHVRRGVAKKLVHITSGMGSIADNTSGGAYAYRMSKVALNMASRSLSVDLRGEGIASYVINPGFVQTDMGGSAAPTPVADSVRGILSVIDAATLNESGEFLNWKGDRYPW